MEVVVLRIAESDEGADYVDKRCAIQLAIYPRNARGISSVSRARTHGRGILAKVPLLVATQEALGLHFGSGTSG